MSKFWIREGYWIERFEGRVTIGRDEHTLLEMDLDSWASVMASTIEKGDTAEIFNLMRGLLGEGK